MSGNSNYATRPGQVKQIKFARLSLRRDFEDNNDYATLNWSVREGYPRISVFTSKNTEVGGKFDYNKLITAPMHYLKLEIFYKRLEQVIASKEKVSYNINCYNTKFVNNERTNDIKLQAKITIGKDADGVVFLAVTEDDKKKIKFDILPDKWHKFFDANNDEIVNKAELSAMYADAYLKVLKKSMDGELVKDMKSNDKKPKPNYSKPKQDTTNNSSSTKTSNDDASDEDLDSLFND
jgi:hypothetical protein